MTERSPLREASVTLHVTFETHEVASAIYSALLPETRSAPSERAVTRLELQDRTIIVSVHARDITALRAAVNSFLSWMSSCYRTVSIARGQSN